jgi:hypothetical protein
MFWSTVGARSSFVILDWQGAFLRTKTRIDAACPATSVPGGFGPQRSFWSRRNTEKEWTCGLLDASYTSWWHSQCSKKQTSTKRSNVCSEAAIATHFLRETKLLQREPRTSSRPSWRCLEFNRICPSSRLDPAVSFSRIPNKTWLTARTISKKCLTTTTLASKNCC